MIELQVERGRVLVGRLERGDDLLDELTARCRDNGIGLGRVEAIGAVECSRVGYYDQRRRLYSFFDLDGPMELLALAGNVSTKDGEPFVHAHVTFSDAAGGAFGGHLAQGTRVFACEYVIEELTGGQLTRGPDEATGLPLWQPK